MTSSIAVGSTPARRTASPTTSAARSSARMLARAPPYRPTGVRTPPTRYASDMLRRYDDAGRQLLLVEGLAAGARAAGVGVVDREALLLDGVHEVDRRAGEVGHAHAVDDDLHRAAGVLLHGVAVEGPLVEEELVAQAGAAAGLDGHPEGEVVAALLGQQRLHLVGGGVGEHD